MVQTDDVEFNLRSSILPTLTGQLPAEFGIVRLSSQKYRVRLACLLCHGYSVTRSHKSRRKSHSSCKAQISLYRRQSLSLDEPLCREH